MRTRMNKFMKGQKSKSTIELLGCSQEDFILWMKFQFDDTMNMFNHGDVWHYDHVIPCALFDQLDEEDQIRCWHWSNYQPMLGSDNMSKQDKVSKADIRAHDKKIDKFAELYCEYLSDDMVRYSYDKYSYTNC